MMKFVAVSLATSVVGLFAAGPAHACGSGSCSMMSAAPVATASAKADRTYSYQPSAGAYRPPMMMRGGMTMGGGSDRGVPRSAGAKIDGN